jgi:hypothetical protein
MKWPIVIKVPIPFSTLPPPTTFAEGQRKRYGILVAAAGMFCGLCAVGMVALLMWGGWSAKEEHTIVVIFGWTLGGYISAMVAVIVGLLVGGPVGKFDLDASTTGLKLKTEEHVDPAAPAKITTTTTVQPGGNS